MAYKIDCKNKTAIVTGGTRGIGASIAEAFARAGADIIITGTHEKGVNQRVKELEGLSTGTVDGWVANFSDAASIEVTCERIRRLESLHVLVNNAGTNHIVPIDEIKAADLGKIITLNLEAPVLLSGAAAVVMKRQRWGRILNIASIWSVITKPGRAMYSASKFGIVGLTKTAAVDLGPYNILVNALSPGFTLTDLTRSTVPLDEQEKIARQLPLRRFAQPEEMANAALFLCSELNSYITGQNIVADGGFVSV